MALMRGDAGTLYIVRGDGHAEAIAVSSWTVSTTSATDPFEQASRELAQLGVYLSADQLRAVCDAFDFRASDMQSMGERLYELLDTINSVEFPEEGKPQRFHQPREWPLTMVPRDSPQSQCEIHPEPRNPNWNPRPPPTDGCKGSGSIHRTAPASCFMKLIDEVRPTGKQHPLLQSAAEKHANFQAAHCSLGHQKWEARSRQLRQRGHTCREVCAFAPGTETDAARQIAQIWRDSPEHSNILKHVKLYGFAMVRGSNGYWYATGIVEA